MWRAHKLATAGSKHSLDGDEELAYYNFYRYVDIISKLRKTEEYKRNEVFHKKFVSKALDTLESLSASLEKRYFLLQKDIAESEAEQAENEVWYDALTDFVEESSTPVFQHVSQVAPASAPKPVKLYVIKNQKVSLPLPRMLLTTLFSSCPSTLLLEKIPLRADIRGVRASSEVSALFCESINRQLQERGLSTLFLTFQVTSFQEDTKLASIAIRAGGPFINEMLMDSKGILKMTIKMKLICESEWDLHFSDTNMKIFKNERGENTGYGIDVGMIACEEWLNAYAPPIKGKVTLKILKDGAERFF